MARNMSWANYLNCIKSCSAFILDEPGVLFLCSHCISKLYLTQNLMSCLCEICGFHGGEDSDSGPL
jgi:hypothetical protein